MPRLLSLLFALLVLALLHRPAFAEGDTVWVRQYHTKHVSDVAFAPDGLTLASVGQDQLINIVNTATGELLRPIQTPNRQFRILFGIHGEGLYSCGSGPEVYLWDPATAEQIRVYTPAHTIKGVATGLSDMTLSKDGRYLATCGYHEVIITDLQTGQQVLKFEPENQFLLGDAVSISPDQNRIAVTGDGLYIVDVQTAEVIKHRKVEYALKGGVEYSPDGRSLVMGCMSKDEDHYVLMVDAETLLQKKRWDIGREVTEVIFSAGGQYVIASSTDGYIRIWDTDTGELVRQYVDSFQQPQYCVAVSPDSSFMASANIFTYLWNAHWTTTGVEQPPFSLQSVALATDIVDDMLQIQFALTAPTSVSIRIVDVQGRVQVEHSGDYVAGEHLQQITTSALAQGVYFCQVQTGDHTITQPFTINR